ncbi:conserved hypothetical protein [Talaromyces stipitatus ATCC 10500]|uniref:Alcohol dehydrogenase iron-type/glycerol dehydrogenase GldA domain-containing protein n=1 Tax=Talaromyces stipitatus (strain ATCC 10500 / CBS 375.48 / QM 6759 / NRRL 1006) TaxID=441959 RepID=B8MJZ8_TALSN|nr:uncharacterized protein TSTA_042870 [Talaromyces stipitatus ATCC 10500]EED14815.1 conserved hypothetical protein [Talaromyces stipitatus ATCC 10500]
MSKQRIQQLPLDSHRGHDAIFNASYLGDIPSALQEWNSKRVLLVVSKALDTKTSIVSDLEARLTDSVKLEHLQKKTGVGSHSPYADIIDIANRVQTNNIDAVISLGSGSYSDACKIAVMLSATLQPGFTETDMENLIDQKHGLAGYEKLNVPTSLSAGEWNSYASGTNSRGKKQHFGHASGSPTLILCDPRVAATTPAHLWLASGVRAVDHCVEGLGNVKCHEEAFRHFENGLKCFGDRKELLEGISECQAGSRKALLPFIKWHVSFGASHAIGHQLGSVAGVQHGSHDQVLSIFNKTLNWHEQSASDAVAKFVKLLGLPTRLSEVGVTNDEQIRKIAEMALTDVLARDNGLPAYEGIVEILDSAR